MVADAYFRFLLTPTETHILFVLPCVPIATISLNLKPAKKSTPAEIERLKASRRAALARVAHKKQQKEAQQQEVERTAMEETMRKEAEVASKADALRAAAAARAATAAAEKWKKERELENLREAEAHAKRERVAAVLARKDSEVVERERQVRNETIRRIRREEWRRELERQRQEDERVERVRLYEAGERAGAAAPAGLAGLAGPPLSLPQPAVQSARSFFSVGTRPSSRQSIGLENTASIDEGYDANPTTTVVSNKMPSKAAPDGSDGDKKTSGSSHHQNPSGQKVVERHAPSACSTDINNDEDTDLLEEATQQWATTTTAPVTDPKSTGSGNTRVGVDGPPARGRTLDAAEENEPFRHRNRQREGYSQVYRQSQQHPEPQRSRSGGGGNGSGNRHSVRSRQDAERGASAKRAGSYRTTVQEPSSTTTTGYGRDSNSQHGSESRQCERGYGKIVRGKGVRNSEVLSPEPSTGVRRGPETCSGAATVSSTSSSGSVGSSSVQGRKRIKATPVWKRPIVPLSKPYVPVPRKDGCFTVR